MALGLASVACGIGDGASNAPQTAPPVTPDAPVEPIPSQAPGQHRVPAPQPPVLAEDPVAKSTPHRDDLRLERVEADVLMAELQRLPKFPLRLSELEAHLGRPVRQFFNPEQHDPTFVDDQGGQGVNVGGVPVHHPSGGKETPLLFELRSQHHARYDHDRRFRDRPPFAADDPVVDLISLSGPYATEVAPPGPAGSTTFEGNYAYTGERWHITPLHDGYVSLYDHDRTTNSGADRWVFEVTTERGFYYSPREVEQTEQTLLGFVDAIEGGDDMPRFLADFEREHAEGFDLGILYLGLTSYNVRFFDTGIAEGEHAGEFLRGDGHSRALYIDSYIDGDARVALPNFFGAFGFDEYVVPAHHMPVASASKREGGFVYYNDVVLEKGGWRIRLTGFYPVKDGKAQSVIEMSKFLVTSMTIRHAVPLRRGRK